MKEARDRHTGVAQALVGPRPKVATTDAVDQYPHLHAAVMGGDQCIMERPARGIGPEDIAFEADALLGTADLLQHAGVGLIAVAQHLDAVALLARQSGQPADGEFQ